MSNNHIHAKEFVVGAAVGSVLGSVVAFLTAPKAGKELREDICDAYCNVSDRAQELAGKGKTLAQKFGYQAGKWPKKAKSALENAKCASKDWTCCEEECAMKELLIGGLVGGLVGVAAGLLLAPKSGEDLREDISDMCEDICEKSGDLAENVSKSGKKIVKKARTHTNQWIDLAKNIAENFSDSTQEKGENLLGDMKDLIDSDRINDAIHLAQAGYRLWQGFQSIKKR